MLKDVSWERMIRAVEKVRERLFRAAAQLEREGVDYAVVGGNHLAAWVSRVDESAVRNTQDVDILLRRADLEQAGRVLSEVGFSFRHARGLDMFLDGPNARARDALHVLYSGELVVPNAVWPAPTVEESERSGGFNLIGLEALVRMKLTSLRAKDRMHLLDLYQVGLIDETWPDRLPPVLAERLRLFLRTPED